ncbi:DsbA family protein [Oricola sp.]|uniref:DsbA family protein n=1 Tax=Oricola sp. TaxID=1979950 RepID=UPI0025DB8C75|nr:DsbA family protein [Oricola sp.]MCI5073651.1 DsbA family protein [Oricola sp.]
MADIFPTRRTVLLTAAAAGATLAAPSLALAQKAPEAKGTVDMDDLLKPGVLEDQVEGAEDAPITVVEYASMTCSHCAHFHATTFPTIKENYIDTGKVRFILREFPLDPRAAAGFMLARCAPEGKYFAMVDVLFKQQAQWAFVQNARPPLENIAKLAGFTQESFEACLTNQKLLDDINATRDRASDEFGVNATPTFFINGTKYSGALTVDQMSAILDALA